jgi:hypothetical protein
MNCGVCFASGRINCKACVRAANTLHKTGDGVLFSPLRPEKYLYGCTVNCRVSDLMVGMTGHTPAVRSLPPSAFTPSLRI